MANLWIRGASTCLALLIFTSVLWNLPIVNGETCYSNVKIRPDVNISSSPENNRLPIGASINLTCTAEPRRIDSGYMDRWVNYIKWYVPHDGRVGAECRQPSNTYAHKLKLSCSLLLKNLTVDKFGRYTCQAGNDYAKHCTRKSFVIARIQDSTKEEEASPSPMATFALFCALATTLNVIIACLWNRLRNQGGEGRQSTTKVLLEKERFLINGIEEIKSPNPIFIEKSKQRHLVCIVENGLGKREPPDGSGLDHSIQDIEERGQESSDWGEETTGGYNLISDGGVDLCVHEQGDRRGIAQEAAEGRDNMENLEVSDEILGEGEFGIVYKGRYGEKNGNFTDVAVKKLKDPIASAKKALLNEIRTLNHVGKHPNIVTLIGTRIDKGSILVITELIRGDNLENLLKARNTPEEWNKYHNVCFKLNDRQLVTIAFQIASGMQHLEERKFVHRDLAARNILVDANLVAKVGDFGLAKDISEAGIYTITSGGSFPWRWSSLESLRDLRFTSASDVWSFGIVLWEITTYGGLPYPNITSPLALVSQLTAGYRMPRPKQCSEELKKITSFIALVAKVKEMKFASESTESLTSRLILEFTTGNCHFLAELLG